MDITPQKMRYLYVLLFLTVMMTLPWLGLTDFHTKGEPREAIVAQTMLANYKVTETAKVLQDFVDELSNCLGLFI